MSDSSLPDQHCQPYSSSTAALSSDQVEQLLPQLDGWQCHDQLLGKTYRFKNYYQTIAFVNAIAWLAHREDHHPDLAVSYNSCRVEYSTHAVHGLSLNDFICAAKVDALYVS